MPRGAPNHELEDGDAERVDVLEHDDLGLFAIRNLLLLLAEGPIASLDAQWHIHGTCWGEVRDLVHDVFVFSFNDDLAEVELSVDEARIVGKVQALRQLDCHVVNVLDVRPRHIDRQIQIEALDVLEDAPAVMGLGHREVAAADFFPETVEGGCDVRVRLQVDPPRDVLRVRDLANDKLLSEVLMVDYEGVLADDMFNLDNRDTYQI